MKTGNNTSVGQTVTYHVTITNNGTAGAFEVTLADPLPTGLTLVNPAFPVPSGCTNNSSLPGNVNVTCPQLDDGMTQQITYQATVSTNLPCTGTITTVTNIAEVTWTSLPGPQGTPPGSGNPTGQQTVGPSNNVPNGERNGSSSYPPFPPFSPNPPNDYFATASKTVTVKCGRTQICVTKFMDQNGNGTHDPGEHGLTSWPIAVTDASGNPVPGSPFITGADGTICFVVPAPATYRISEVLQPGWIQTFPPSPGTYTESVSPDQPVDLSFGNKHTGGIVYLPLVLK